MRDSDRLLRDCLYNTHPTSGDNVSTYGQGIVVGVMSTLMAFGLTFDEALACVMARLPEGYDENCIPAAWQQLDKG